MAIWNLGSINIDHVYRIARLPQPGETLAAQGYQVGLGGKGANQSIAAARAGSATRHLGAISAMDDWVIGTLDGNGVDTSAIMRLEAEATGHAIILLDDTAENAIVIHPGANRALTGDWLHGALEGIAPADTLLLQNETDLQPQAAAIAAQKGARVIYSAAPFELAALRAVIGAASIIALNEGEANQLFAAMPGDLPVEGLLITRGAEGAEYRDLTTGESHYQPAFKVAALDTTGAGDCFAGYFAAALDQRMAIPEALRLASAAAALAVSRYGAADAIPTRAEVEAFIKNA